MSELITIEVNGKAYQVRAGQMLIEATDDLGIEVPRFCYHKHLSIAANCRMCLVEVEKMGKPLPACATPVASGMKVWTRSAKAVSAQQAMMEFLLINHPLDCPICDQGGECELQDQALAYGKASTRFQEIKRVVVDKDIGPLVETEMTRCIQCTRCIRFGTEVAGLRELGGIGRGDRLEISTYIEKTLESELSGNVIDVCPVGALTAKPSRYTARAWEMQAHPSIAAHDSVGSNVEIHTFDGKVVRVVPRENDAVNQCWIADRDRFSYEGLYHAERVHHPMIKREGHWQTVSWVEALKVCANVLADIKPDSSVGLVSANSTLEELYLFQKLLRGVGVSTIDHRLQLLDSQVDTVLPPVPSLGMPLATLAEQRLIILIGSHVRHEQPMLNHRIRLASRRGARVIALNPREYHFNYPVEQLVLAPSQWVNQLSALLQQLEQYGYALPAACPALPTVEIVNERITKLATVIQQAHQMAQAKVVVLLGNTAMQHPQAADIALLAQVLADQLNAKLGFLPSQANSVGAALVGAVPYQGAGGVRVTHGKTVHEALKSSVHTAFLLNTEPEFDCADPAQAVEQLNQATQVIAMTPFLSQRMRDYATVILPCAAWCESSGSYVNAQGLWQSARAATEPPVEARPAWKILRVLGSQLGLSHFDYQNLEQVTLEIKPLVAAAKLANTLRLQSIPDLRPSTVFKLERIGDGLAYRSDSLVRRAKALQALVPKSVAYVHPVTAAELGLQAGDQVEVKQGRAMTQLTLQLDATFPAFCVGIASGTQEASALGELFGMIELTKV